MEGHLTAVGAPRSVARRQRQLLAVALTALGACLVLSAAGSASRAAGLPKAAPPSVKSPSPGQWTEITTAVDETKPVVWMSATDKASIAWYYEIGTTSKFTYELVVVGPSGAVVTKPVSIFGSTGWSSLSSIPTLVSQGNEPLIIFPGAGFKAPYAIGGIFGALPATPDWKPQSWSLSHSTDNIAGYSATETKTGELSAAWAGSDVWYHIGTTPGIPAKAADSSISRSKTTVFDTREASDVAGSDNIYIGWTQGFSTPASADGYYVKDVSADGPVRKAPGSGTNSVNNLNGFSSVAMTNTNTHAGIFMLYCSNGSACSLELWHVGAAKAITVPHSSDAWDYEVTAGPDGRLWIAWSNQAADTVSTVRTNKADTSFGPVETYKIPFCFEHPLLGISGGTYGRLDVVVQCVKTTVGAGEYVTQSETALSVSPSATTIKNTAANSITFKVTDVGDTVAGATVSVDGKKATTGTSGTAKISFPKGTKTGTYAVTVTAPDYFAAHGTLHVDS
jgi:hypothetical protein